MHGALAILVALIHRNRTGEGQYIDISEWEATTSLLGEPLMEYLMNGRIPGPTGNRDSIMAPHGYYPCKGEGQWVSIAVKTDEEWRDFCQALGNPPWTEEERFGDRYSRLLNQDALDKFVGQWTANHSPLEVTEILQQAGVAAAPFLISKEQYHDPHFKERGIFVEVNHPKSGREVFYGIPWKLSDTPGEVRASGPLLGQDNEYVFKELLGLSQGDFEHLVEEKIIF
jgi:benzylsuccinate CoA-transferase BbsF subunit